MKMAATLIATDTIAPLTLIDDEAYPTLFSIIFGEGISNDAVALILMTTVLKLDNTSSGEGKIKIANRQVELTSRCSGIFSLTSELPLFSALYSDS
jgi:NhaP-type Na+/H+ or K+/H+ antiporter